MAALMRNSTEREATEHPAGLEYHPSMRRPLNAPAANPNESRLPFLNSEERLQNKLIFKNRGTHYCDCLWLLPGTEAVAEHL
jgi:hypothetical protein